MEIAANSAHRYTAKEISSRLFPSGDRDPLPAVSTAVANIALGAVSELAGRLDCHRLVTSGYLVSDPVALPGYVRLHRLGDEGWAADLWEPESE